MNRKFSRNMGSYVIVSHIVLMVVLICIGVPFLFMKRYLISLIYLTFAALLFIRIIKIPSFVTIDTDFILLDKDKILWTDISEVHFTTAPPGRDSRDTVIVLKMKYQKNQMIHTNYYKNSKELRILFEDMCKEKEIKYIVRDRGLY